MNKKSKLLAVVFSAVLASLTATSAHAESVERPLPYKGEVQLKPYAFGTVGAARDGLQTDNKQFNERDTRPAAQVGVGVQFNDHIGGEMYYQSGSKFKYKAKDGTRDKIMVQNIGTRATFGTSARNKARVFAKLGVVVANHDSKLHLDSNNRPRLTAGVGASYNINDNFAVRGDYDHQFKRHSNIDRKGSDYLGMGGQVNF